MIDYGLVQRERCRLISVAKPALAGLLAVWLVIAGALSLSHALHQSVHPDSSGGSHLCLLCSLAKGHVQAADAALIVAIPVLFLVLGGVLPERFPLSAFDYRFSPSRAPPAPASKIKVVG
jgi:hypothetical protein